MDFRMAGDSIELSFTDEEERVIVADWMRGGGATPRDMAAVGRYGVGEWWPITHDNFHRWKQLASEQDGDLFDVLPDVPDPDCPQCAELLR